MINKSGINKEVDYKLITPETKNLKPWGNEDFDILVIWALPSNLIDEFITHNPCIKLIHTLTAGVDNICTDTMINFPAPLTNSKGAFSYSLAEFIAFGMLWHAKDGQKWQDMKVQKKWDPTEVQLIKNKVMGVVGYGDVGFNCAKIAKTAFGAKIIALDKRDASEFAPEPREIANHIFGFDKLDQFLSRCDYIVSCLPLTNETKHFWNLEKFKKMKKSAVFMNIGRGPNVNEIDLCKALHAKIIQGAVLDVFEQEPLPKTSPIWDAPNLFMTPHCADITVEFFENAFDVCLDNLRRYKQGGAKNVKNVVNKKLGY